MSKLNIEDIFVGETLYAGDYDEVVTVHLIDEDNGKVYCADETFGISMWYDLDVLKKINDEPEEVVLDDDFLAFAKALETVAKFNGIDIPQVEVNEEPNVVDDDFDDFNLDFDDDDDYEDDILDERYDGNRFPDYKFNFYNALEELQFQYVNEDRNVIWYMTNGERALTFKDNRLVDVRLSEHIENFVYFSAPIHVDDLLDKWEVHSIVDEETRKIQEIAALAESLHNESLMLELLEVIEKYL
jgi:hypothetical protein